MRRLICWLGVLSAILALGILSVPVWAAFTPPPAPTDGYVVDQTGTLSNTEINELNQQIETYRQSGKVEIGVLMISKFTGSYLEEASLATARTWGIGQSAKNNGVLLFIAKDDRLLRIEVGKGLEGELTDAQSGRIIRQWITPEFKQGNYFAGIKRGLEGVAGSLSLADVDMSSLRRSGGGLSIFYLITALAFFWLIIRMFWKGRGCGRGVVVPILIDTGGRRSSSSRSSSGFGRRSGGGFSGGGGFGGGGASGSW